MGASSINHAILGFPSAEKKEEGGNVKRSLIKVSPLQRVELEQ